MLLVRIVKQIPELCRFNTSISRFSSQSSDNNYVEYERRKFARRFGNIVRHHDKDVLPRLEEVTESDQDDFFGIKTFSADDVKGIDGLDDTKRQKLDKKVNELSNLQGLVPSEEGFLRPTSYGKVRYDRENKVDYMGQFEQNSNHVLLEKRRRYMLEIISADGKNEKMNLSKSQGSEEASLNYIDQQYFDINTEKQDKKSQASDSSDLNFIDYQYFKDNYSTELSPEGFPSGPINFQFTSKWNEYKEYLNSHDHPNFQVNQISPEQLIENLDSITFAGDTPLRSVEEVSHELILMQNNSQNEEIQDSTKIENESVNVEIQTDDKKNINSEAVEDVPKTALDYIMKVRQGKLIPEDKAYLEHLEKKFKKFGDEFKMRNFDVREKTYDSTGKRNFLEQSPKLNFLRRNELIELLAQRILFNERDLIAIDKPNGLVVEGGQNNAKYPSLESLLPDLSRKLFDEENQLYLVHRLDRDATGVLLLARSSSMVKTLREMFSKRKISKYYWAIVRGSPDPLNGIIDIPIESGKINGIERMHLKPDCDLDFNRQIGATRGAYVATTHYRTVRKCGNASLVETKPEQGVKHQIRVHLGFGLRTPILGDHKYSHLDKLAPQKLPDDMLKKLNVRQAKVRNIPLHLHSKLYIIPEIGMNGSSISISAHLPGFFRANMSSLGLYKQTSVLKNPIAF